LEDPKNIYSYLRIFFHISGSFILSVSLLLAFCWDLIEAAKSCPLWLCWWSVVLGVFPLVATGKW